jgi:hypothetical protein
MDTTHDARLTHLLTVLDREALETLIDLLDGDTEGRVYRGLCQEHRARYPALYGGADDEHAAEA